MATQSLKPIQFAFISYAHEDAEFALRLAEDLRAGGAAVWMDRLDINPGQHWDTTVEAALGKCPQLLVILSPAAVKSTNVMDEVSFALDKGKTVLPVIHRQCEIPFRLRRLQRVDLTLNYKPGLSRLLDTLGFAEPPSKPPEDAVKQVDQGRAGPSEDDGPRREEGNLPKKGFFRLLVGGGKLPMRVFGWFVATTAVVVFIVQWAILIRPELRRTPPGPPRPIAPIVDGKFRTVSPKVEQATAVEPEKARATAAQAVTGASKERPYENSLGMKFVPVPGTGVLFSIWETRVKDYKVFVEAKNREWPKPSFQQTEEHPAVNVSWWDATAFCEWLTEQEHTAGRISAKQSYRLPSDEEWSAAVGLEKEGGSTPKERGMKVKGVYPWGTKWPPPNGAGNYDPNLKVDDYQNTSPAGSFEANRYGIHDLGGNVWEWCQDWYDAERKDRVLRGASWGASIPDRLLSSCRVDDAPEDRDVSVGFRCVLVMESSR